MKLFGVIGFSNPQFLLEGWWHYVVFQAPEFVMSSFCDIPSSSKRRNHYDQKGQQAGFFSHPYMSFFQSSVFNIFIWLRCKSFVKTFQGTGSQFLLTLCTLRWHELPTLLKEILKGWWMKCPNVVFRCWNTLNQMDSLRIAVSTTSFPRSNNTQNVTDC